MNSITVVSSILVFLTPLVIGFDWKDSGNVRWAPNCDWNGGDIGNVQVRGEDCGGKCAERSDCTRFTWTSYKGGTCFLKSGDASENKAIWKGDSGAVCGYKKGNSGGGGGSSGGSGHQMSFVNSCPFPVWVGALSKNLPNNGGWKLNPGESNQLSLGAGWQGRFWGRTDCAANGHCATGDCGNRIQCNGAGGVPPATLAEFQFDGHGGLDYYDVSLVDGYNLPMAIESNKRGGGGKYDCTTAGCNSDLNAICPGELAVKHNGRTVACKSACEAFNTDAYCCRGAHGTPQTCKSSNWPTNFPAIFKRACPNAYSYAYDDSLSTFTCQSANPSSGYIIKFCP